MSYNLVAKRCRPSPARNLSTTRESNLNLLTIRTRKLAKLMLTLTGSLAFILLPLLSVDIVAEENPLAYGEPIELCKIKNKKVTESSGLAVSRRNKRFFWTHNDSGDKPRLYCFDVDGVHQGTCKLKPAGAIDWEDMCSFESHGRPKLLVGDIGDNGAKRKSCRLYLLDEPEDPSHDVKKLQIIKLTYSTGPMDCEAIGVDPISQKLILVEKKRWISCRVFAADFQINPATGMVMGKIGDTGIVEITAKPIGVAKISIVASMDISNDGRRAILATLGESFEYTKKSNESWADAFARKPRRIKMPARRQGETICYGANGRDLFLTSELVPTPLFKVPAIR